MKIKLMGLLVCAGLSAQVAANDITAEGVIKAPGIVGGYHKTFTQYNGKDLIHEPGRPRDGIGIYYYLEDLCRGFGFDDFVEASYTDTAGTAHIDTSTGQWVENAGNRVYTSLTCAVYLR